jgi:hypothetical protein
VATDLITITFTTKTGSKYFNGGTAGRHLVTFKTQDSTAGTVLNARVGSQFIWAFGSTNGTFHTDSKATILARNPNSITTVRLLLKPTVTLAVDSFVEIELRTDTYEDASANFYWPNDLYEDTTINDND